MSTNQDLSEIFSEEHSIIRDKFTQIVQLYHSMKNPKTKFIFELVSKRPDFTDIVNVLYKKYEISRHNTLYSIDLRNQKYHEIRNQINKYFENIKDVYYNSKK